MYKLDDFYPQTKVIFQKTLEFNENSIVAVKQVLAIGNKKERVLIALYDGHTESTVKIFELANEQGLNEIASFECHGSGSNLRTLQFVRLKQTDEDGIFLATTSDLEKRINVFKIE